METTLMDSDEVAHRNSEYMEQGGEFRGLTRTRGSHGSNLKYQKLELLTFEGTNPDRWVLRAERYFLFYNLTEEENWRLLWREWTAMLSFGTNGNTVATLYKGGRS